LTPLGLSCGDANYLLNIGVDIPGWGYSWVHSSQYPAYTVSANKSGTVYSVSFVPESLSEIDPATGEEVARHDLSSELGPWTLKGFKIPLGISSLWQLEYTLQLPNEATILFKSAVSDLAFNVSGRGEEVSLSAGSLKVALHLTEWKWKRPHAGDYLRLSFRIPARPPVKRISHMPATLRSEMLGDQLAVKNGELNVGVFLEDTCYSGPTALPVAYSDVQTPDGNWYIYVDFPHFTSDLDYDPDFGILTASSDTDGEDDGDGGAQGDGDGGFSDAALIVLAVLIPAGTMLFVVVAIAGIVIGIWKRRRIATFLKERLGSPESGDVELIEPN